MNAKDTGISFASTLKEHNNKSPDGTANNFNPQPRRNRRAPLSLSFNHFEDFGKSNDGEMNKDILNVT